MKKIIFLILAFVLVSFTESYAGAWSQKADFGGGKIYDAASFVIGKYAYIATGSNDAMYGYGLQRFMYRYDPSIDVWKRMADLPPGASARFNAVGFAVGGKGYICGGVGDASLWEYDPETNLWYQRTDCPRVIEEGIGFTITSKAYVGLGGASIIDYKNDFYEFDPSKNKWTQLNDFPGAPRRGSIGFSMNGKGYVGLGYKDIGSYNKAFFKDLWEYDPLTDDWTRLPDLPGDARQDAIGFGIDGAIYVGMGGINDFYKLDLKTKEWSTLNYIPGSSRVYAFSFCIGSGIYYGGGMSPNMASDMWGYTESTSSVDNEITSLAFTLTPSPATDEVHIQLGQDLRVEQIKIFNLNGEIVAEYLHPEFVDSKLKINVNELPNGIYSVVAISGNKSYSSKMIITR